MSAKPPGVSKKQDQPHHEEQHCNKFSLIPFIRGRNESRISGIRATRGD
jgi:hypothetical protein